MASTAYDIVVFDLGGVLVQIAQSWAEALQLAGLAPHRGRTGDAFDRARVALGEAYQLGALTSAEYQRRLAAASGGAYVPADIALILDAWSGLEYDGVGAVVDAVESAGATTGALSNTNPAHWARLDGTAEYPTVARLRYRHASHLLGVAKPDPRIFEAFSAAVRVPPGRTLFFDDAPVNVEAARRSGWAAEAVDPDQPTAPQLLAHLRRHGLVGASPD